MSAALEYTEYIKMVILSINWFSKHQQWFIFCYTWRQGQKIGRGWEAGGI